MNTHSNNLKQNYTKNMDDSGSGIDINNIVTTEPSSTEIIAYLDQGVNRIVGVSDKCDYPAEVLSKPKVVRSVVEISDNMSSREIDEVIKRYKRSGKPLFKIDWDLIYDLDPDLIVGQSICDVCAFPLKTAFKDSLTSHSISRFKSFKVFKVAEYSPHDFMGIASEALRIARVIDRVDRGLKLYQEFEKYVEELKGLGKGYKTAIIEWLDPIYVAGHWASDLVERSGSRSIVPSGEPGRGINAESLINFNPDILIISPCGFSINRTLMEIDLLTNKPWWRRLEAFKKDNIFVFDPTFLSRPSPRTVRFAEFLIDIYTGSEPSREIAIRI